MRSRPVHLRTSMSLSIALVGALAAILALPSVASPLPRIPARSFRSAATCGCHRDLIDQWRYSMHAQALYDPVYVTKKTEANRATKGALGSFCDTCHTPIGSMAGEVPSKRLSAQSREGVTCDFCHQVTGTRTPIGNASQTLRADGTERAQLRDARTWFHRSAYSAFHRRAEFCGACHSLRHPTTGVSLDTTYEEWKAGPYAAEGIVCQDCHMSLGPGRGPTAGRAAAFGPPRDSIYLMNFVGANVALGDPELARLNLTSAASVTIQAPEIVPNGDSSLIRVYITNVGAGHGIPTGETELREMWLEVAALRPDGTRTPLGMRAFGTVLQDAKGRAPAQLWNATSIRSDDRIAPRETVESAFTLRMRTAGEVTIEAVLNYRSFPDDLAKKARVANPITRMAEERKVVYGSEAARDGAARRARFGVLADVPALPAAAATVAVFAAVGLILARRRRRRRRREDVA